MGLSDLTICIINIKKIPLYYESDVYYTHTNIPYLLVVVLIF